MPQPATTDTLSLLALVLETLKLMVWLAPAHQAFVELYKLTGRRVRRYYEALAYIVFGVVPTPTLTDAALDASQRAVGRTRASNSEALSSTTALRSLPAAEGEHAASVLAHSRADQPLSVRERLTLPTRLVPEELGAGIRREWVVGAQRNLIESFALRAVGDNPISEISDADVQNVVQVVRLAAPVEVRRTVETLNSLLEAGERSAASAAHALEGIDPKGSLEPVLRAWIEELRAGGDQHVGVVLAAWRRTLIEERLTGELRARVDLGNALKAAEYRYHHDVRRASLLLAAIEGVGIGWLASRGQVEGLGTLDPVSSTLIAVLSFGFLLVLPQASKSVLDIVVGLGNRLKP